MEDDKKSAAPFTVTYLATNQHGRADRSRWNGF